MNEALTNEEWKIKKKKKKNIEIVEGMEEWRKVVSN
jgi:hypothetical protein